MIEIITEAVEMPKSDKRRFQKECSNPNTIKQDKWFVLDSENSSVVFKGKFEEASIACHSLNKKYYKYLKQSF